MRGRRAGLAAVTVSVLAALIAPVRGSAAETYAPLDRPGPALSVPVATLKAALHCSGSFHANSLEPVLLNPATGVTPDQNYSWNYERAFTTQGRPWCALTMPFHTLGDIQTAGEYLVYGIRTMHAMAGRRIAVLGHSQGGMSMRWALRFWPDTRPMVDDVIGMAGSNHGTTVLQQCIAGATMCTPADWQQAAGSKFITALNSRAETFPSISYTEIFTHTDEVVQPDNVDATASSAVTRGPNVTDVATQDVCPLDVDEHLTVGTIDPTTYALVMDALTHAGPAQVSRIDPAVCLQPYQPGVDPTSAATYLQTLQSVPGLGSVALPNVNPVGAPEVAAEPALRCYTTFVGCAGQTPTPAPTSTSAHPTAAPSTATPTRSTRTAAAAGTSTPLSNSGPPTWSLLSWALVMIAGGSLLTWTNRARRPQVAEPRRPSPHPRSRRR